MKFNRKFFIFSVVILSFILVGCSIHDGKERMYNNKASIVSDADSFTFVKRSENSTGANDIKIHYGGFSGVDTILEIESKDTQTIGFDFDSSNKDGKFKAVLVTPQKEIQTICEGSKKGKKKVKIDSGKYFLKIVGSNAKGDFNISYDRNDNVMFTLKGDLF